MGLSGWSGYSLAVYSGYPLASSKLGIYPFPLALPLDQNENWDSAYSNVNVQN